MNITLKQVAASAGVSYQTVWRAIHDTPGILPSTRAQVLEVAARLGYRRNRVAGSLRTQQSAVLGLIVLDVSNPHTGSVTSGIEDAASAHGYSVLLMNSHDDVARERAAVASLMEQRVAGLIINPARGGDHAYLGQDLPPGFPLVAINRPIPGLDSPTVQTRHEDVADVVGYFARLGHRRVGGIFGPFENEPFLHRCTVLQHSLRERRLPVRQAWLATGENSTAFARAAVRAMLSRRDAPTALFAASHRLTEGALLGFRDLGLRQGEDIALVGFDLHYAGLLSPPMPTMMQPAHDMGRLAVQTVLHLVGGGAPPVLPPLPMRLVLDQSGG